MAASHDPHADPMVYADDDDDNHGNTCDDDCKCIGGRSPRRRTLSSQSPEARAQPSYRSHNEDSDDDNHDHDHHDSAQGALSRARALRRQAAAASYRDDASEHGSQRSAAQSVSQSQQSNRVVPFEMSLLECSCCLRLLHEPVMTGCGHTFCKACLISLLAWQKQCPLCRTTIPETDSYYPNLLAKNLVQNLFPNEDARRQRELERARRAASKRLPMFLLDMVLLPGAALPLHIFDPRHKTLVNRCMAGNRRFGVLLVTKTDSGTKFAQIGTVAEIVSVTQLPDDRSLITCIGRERFLLQNQWVEDDVLHGAIEPFPEPVPLEQVDFPDLPDDPMRTGVVFKPGVTHMFDQAELSQLAILFAKARRDIAAHLQTLSVETQKKMGAVPAHPTAFSFWLASVLPVGKTLKQQLLEIPGTTARLRTELEIWRRLQAKRRHSQQHQQQLQSNGTAASGGGGGSEAAQRVKS